MADIKPPKNFNITSGDVSNSWKQWLQQFEWYEIATELSKKSSKIQCATFMVSLGSDIITIYNNFKLKEDEQSDLAKLKQKFTEYFVPKKNVTFERYTFNNMRQEPGESFDDFYNKILKQSKNCDFGDLAEDLVKDKIVIGVNDNQLRQKLLASDNLDLNKAVKCCRAAEQAQIQVKILETKTDILAVNTMKSQKSEKRNVNPNTKPNNTNCTRCGSNHGQSKCPALNQNCAKCQIRGHTDKMCRTSKRKIAIMKSKTKNNKVNFIAEASDGEEEFLVCSISDKLQSESDWIENIVINGKNSKVKIDTGARCNVMSEKYANSLKLQIDHSETKYIVSFTDHKMQVLGETTTICSNGTNQHPVTFKIVHKPIITIIGYDSCKKLNFINQINEVKLPDLYQGLGCVKNFEYDIDLIDNPSFEIKPARRVPLAIKEEVKQELIKMEKMGVIKKMKEPTPVVSPMVVVRKNKKIRICIDPTDVNKCIKRRHYPLNTLEEIAAKICGAKLFTKLDCNKGFWQIKVSKRTEKYLTFATPWGRYCCTRLPFGLSSAPEVFQEMMSSLFQDIDNVQCSMDDILIYADSEEKLDETTLKVFGKLKTAGLILNKDKCQFKKESIKFLGHVLTADGIKADPDKVDAINRLKQPTKREELQRLLGMVTYLHKFIPNLSSITDPLRELLSKDTSWNWESHHTDAFERIKILLKTSPVLAYYDVNKDVILSVDASSKAVGVALIQNGRPVAYATKALTKCQQLYPQIEKEALAIKIGCSKFHEYVYGKPLIIETDHKPLESIFKKSIHCAPPRLQRILLEIIQYNPKVIYKKGAELYLADTLSRDCINETSTDNDERNIEVQIILPMTQECYADMVEATRLDDELQCLLETITTGWPNIEHRNTIKKEIQKYWNFREELSTYKGLIFKGYKVVVPHSQISRILNCIHQGHAGIQACQSRARQSLYWYGMNNDIKDLVEKCLICQKTQKRNIREPIISKQIPQYPFQIVASDICTIHGNNYIVLADSYSGFFDVEKLNNSTSEEVITFLKRIFSLFGTPEVVESDNGPQYSSKLFKDFARNWNFEHRPSSPNFPRANGLAERYIQTAKNMLKKCMMDNSDIYIALLNHRNTPGLGNISPNQKLQSRITNSQLVYDKELLKPKIFTGVSQHLKENRAKQKLYADKNSKKRNNLPTKGDNVRVQVNHREWVGAKVTDVSKNPRSLLIQTNQGQNLRRNHAHISKTKADFASKSLLGLDDTDTETNSNQTTQVNNPDDPTSLHSEAITNTANGEMAATNITSGLNINNLKVTRSGRVSKPINRLDL